MKIDSQLQSILALIFGILILAKPDILAILIALFLIIWGILGLMKK